MSYISKALKKIEDSRQNRQDHQPEKIVYLADVPPQIALRMFLVVGTVVAILISITVMILIVSNSDSKQIEVLNLEKNIKAQEKRMNDLVSTINKNEKIRDVQIFALNSHLNKGNVDIKAQINNSISADNEHYANLKDALLNDQEDIAMLNKEIEDLNQKIKAMSIPNVPVKDTISPASGN